MTLNKKQQVAYNEVLKGSEPIVVLTGAGGTGKSFTTGKIIKDFVGEVLITATTNKAKDILATMAEKRTFTTQSCMGYSMVKKGYDLILAQVRDPKQGTLLIVDEVSMLPYKVYKTILEQIKSGTLTKVLFLGDPIQLPAIGRGVKIESIKGVHIELTKQLRQTNDDKKLTKFLKDLRKTIEEGSTLDNIDGIPSITVHTEHRSFCEAYNRDTSNKKVVAYRNAVVNKYNEYIHDAEERYNVGDEVVIDKPITYNDCMTLATNGEQVLITKVQRHPTLPYYTLEVVTNVGGVAIITAWDSTSVLDAYLEELEQSNNYTDYWTTKNSAFNLKHLYACTVHKTQGSTYDNVYVDATDIYAAYEAKPSKWAAPISYDLFLRLLYVSISRMTTHCHIYYGTVRNYKFLRN